MYGRGIVPLWLSCGIEFLVYIFKVWELDLGSIVDEKYREKALFSLELYADTIKQIPIQHSYIVNQMQRYINEDRILKIPFHTNIKNVRKILQYPYITIIYTSENRVTLCDNHSCFKSLNSLEELGEH